MSRERTLVDSRRPRSTKAYRSFPVAGLERLEERQMLSGAPTAPAHIMPIHAHRLAPYPVATDAAAQGRAPNQGHHDIANAATRHHPIVIRYHAASAQKHSAAGVAHPVPPKSHGVHALSITQTVTVTDRASGKPLANAKVAVTDGYQTKVPVTTNALGQATVTTNNGIRTITSYKDGYAPNTVTINSSARNYSTSLQPLTSTLVKQRFSAIATDVWELAKITSTPQFLGSVRVDKILVSTFFASLGATGVCAGVTVASLGTAAVATAPCMAATSTAMAASGIALNAYGGAVILGMPNSLVLNFYYIPSLHLVYAFPSL